MSTSQNTNPKESKKKDKACTKHKKARMIISLLLVLIAIILGADMLVSNTLIAVRSYTLESDKISTPIRIALVSDLHNKEFGSENAKFFEKIREQHPHIILTVGDMISKNHTERDDIDSLSYVLSELSEIAPVYFSLGNHERNNPELESIKETVTSSGATLLDMEYTDTVIGGNRLRIGGLSYYRRWDEESNAFLTEYTLTSDGDFTLLLCHNPEFYLWGIEDYTIDLVASGHTHGGMVNIPFIGPLFAPEQGWFPEYAGGFYEMENGYLAVSRGLGSSPEFLPRINNRPEIMIIEVI